MLDSAEASFARLQYRSETHDSRRTLERAKVPDRARSPLHRFLWLLLALPVIAILRARRGPRAAVRYASTDLVREVGRTTRSRFGRLLPYLRFPALALMIVALARPQSSLARSSVKASGVDIMLALDVSGSMASLDLTLDGKPADRLSVVKSVVAKFIDQRPNDRIGMIAFAGAPYLVSPLTLDHDWLERNLDARPARHDRGRHRDRLGADRRRVNRLRTSDAHTKIIVLLTDGVNNSGKVQPLLAAEAAAALGIKVYTIGVGTEGKAPMPITRRRRPSPHRDDRGRRRREDARRDRDQDRRRVLPRHRHRIAEARSTPRSTHSRRPRARSAITSTTTSEFVWALLPGLALLAAELGTRHDLASPGALGRRHAFSHNLNGSGSERSPARRSRCCSSAPSASGAPRFSTLCRREPGDLGREPAALAAKRARDARRRAGVRRARAPARRLPLGTDARTKAST